MPKLTIDGKDIEVAAGTTVIQAAAAAGIKIPHYCWHPGLSVAGNCRMCLVEIEKMPKLAISCSTLAADGMVVRTANDRVKEARDAIMEFLLINHPLDCPICDQAGECRLQEYSYRYGSSGSRFVEEKVHKPKKVDIGTHILFDAERCILCTRCVRFCQEVSKTDELTVAQRGDHAIIETFPGRSLDNPYSGNTADICPVGALTVKEFRFKSRVWFLRNTPSVCPGCARGCSITIGSRDTAGADDAGSREHRILRYLPRENPAVNRWWMCDEGRLSYQNLEGAKRIASPAVSRGKGAPHLRSGWSTALEESAARIRELREQHGAGSLALLASPRSTNEDLFLAGLLAREGLGGAKVYLPRHERGENDDLLIRKDKSPNLRGASEILSALNGGTGSVGELAEAVRSGRVKGLVMMGHTITGFEPDEVVPAQDLCSLEALILIDGFETTATPVAGVQLPAQVFGEFEGSVTNFLGQVQRVRAAVPTRADAWPAWRALQELGRLIMPGTVADSYPRFSGAQAVFAALAKTVPAFAGLSYAVLGDWGAPLSGGGPAPSPDDARKE
jgi:NADH-quinone oxidoreductase subunit G